MCIFCQIIKGEIPSYKVFENEHVFSILDIHPNNPGHMLVFPKQHFLNLEEIDEDSLAELMKGVKKAGALLKDKLGVEGYNVHENNDPVAGQVIPHIHFHVIPRNSQDGLKHWPGGEYKEGEAEKILEKLLA